MATTIEPISSTGPAADAKNSDARFCMDLIPPGLKRTLRTGQQADVWRVWTEHLERRKRPKLLASLFPAGSSPLSWGWPAETENRGAFELERTIGQRPSTTRQRQRLAEHAVDWLAGTEAIRSAAFARDCVAWAHALPELAAALPEEMWWKLLNQLHSLAIDAAPMRGETDVLAWQLLAGELPLTLAYLFPELEGCRVLLKPARRTISNSMQELLDGEGLPASGHLAIFPQLLGCWTRCRALMKASDKLAWDTDSERQYRWVVQNAIRLSRADGTQMLAGTKSDNQAAQLLRAACDLIDDRPTRTIAAVALEKSGKASKVQARKLPSPAIHSEWAETAVLRSEWSQSAPRLAVTYGGQNVNFELAVGRDTLWAGRWGLEVGLNGPMSDIVVDWEEVCWLSDKDVDYLELEGQCDNGLRIQRHLLMAREDQFLFLADAILGSDTGRIDYKSSLPLGPQVAFNGAKETREGVLVARKPRALVMPLALPEWRTDSRGGELVRSDCGLELHQSASGRCLFAPLFFDLDPRRMKKELTWRQLTVAEQRQIQAPEVAVGYRVQVGKKHWLIYRSLARPGIRTVLGQNLSTELLVARFLKSGESETLVDIQTQ